MNNDKECPYCGKTYGTVLRGDETVCPVCRAELPNIEETKENKEDKQNGD